MYDVSTLCSEIRYWHRQRVFSMDQRKRADLALGAFLRTQFGWRKDDPVADRNLIAARAAAVIKAAEKDKPELAGPEDWQEWGDFALGAIAARQPFAKIETAARKQMDKLVILLPVWEGFAAGVRGLGATSLATVIGEAGDVGSYRSEAALWKRMGLAVMGMGDGLDDHRQGNPGPGATSQDWIAEGYKKRRRSTMFVIGDVLVKVAGPYREIYLKRKAYEIDQAAAHGLIVAPAAEIPKAEKERYRSQIAVHRRAQRYMEKRLLRHLWRAWRNTGLHYDASTEANLRLPSSS